MGAATGALGARNTTSRAKPSSMASGLALVRKATVSRTGVVPGSFAPRSVMGKKASALAAPLACMARTLKRLGRPEEAFLAEARAQAADRTDFRSAMLLASRASEVGLFDIARRSAERATQMAPDADETWWRLAEVHVEAVPGDPAAAAAAVARALAIGAPVTPRQRSIWGRVEAANGRVAAAIEHLEAAMGEADKIPPLARGKAQALLTRLRAQ